MPPMSAVTPLHLLEHVFGYRAFRGRQAEIVDHIIAGGDALVLMPTGGGKSLCYQVPALVAETGLTVVISPLIALMKDQVDSLPAHLRPLATTVNSNMDGDELQRRLDRAAQGEVRLLYAAPERLRQPAFLHTLRKAAITRLVVDEAHCVSVWGHDFRPDYLKLGEAWHALGEPPILALTATAPPRVRHDIVQHLSPHRPMATITGGTFRSNLRLEVFHAANRDEKLHHLLSLCHATKGQGIVYADTRARCEQIAELLRSQDIDAEHYHAGIDNRDAVQERFMAGRTRIIVATIAFGMGIDKPNVRFVAHLDMPKSVEAYYQETGRAGRDGLPAAAWMAYGLADVMGLLQLMSRSQAPLQRRLLERRKLDAMLGFCETTECRRRVLLRYFGEELPERCGNCDTCLAPVESLDGTVAAQKALSCIKRTGERYGVAYLVDVLLGRKNERIVRAGHDQLPTFGVGQEFSAEQWSSVFRQLAAAGLVEVDMEGYGGLRLTPASWEVLKGRRSFPLRQDPLARSTRERVRKKALPLRAPAVENDLFEALRRKRLELARGERIPPYVIFHDNTLLAMVQSRPTTLEEMAEVPGVGEVKLARYGQIFLEVLHSD